MWRIELYSKLFQRVLNASLIGLGLFLCYFLLVELVYIAKDVAVTSGSEHDVLERALMFFLYFGFISMIIKYFNENYHFPLRYLLYIGITATVRFIIVNRENVYENLILSVVILVLMISYMMMTPEKFLNQKHH